MTKKIEIHYYGLRKTRSLASGEVSYKAELIDLTGYHRILRRRFKRANEAILYGAAVRLSRPGWF